MAYYMQCKPELGIDSKRHADVCMHMQIVYTYINRFVSICLESGRAAIMRLMGLVRLVRLVRRSRPRQTARRQSPQFPLWAPRVGAAGTRLPTGVHGSGSGTPGLRLWVSEWRCIWQGCVCVRAARG